MLAAVKKGKENEKIKIKKIKNKKSKIKNEK